MTIYNVYWIKRAKSTVEADSMREASFIAASNRDNNWEELFDRSFNSGWMIEKINKEEEDND